MTFYRNTATLAALVLNLAPHVPPAMLAVVESVVAYDDELQFFGPDADHAPLIATLRADGAVEVAA